MRDALRVSEPKPQPELTSHIEPRGASAVQLREVEKTFRRGKESVPVLRGVSLDIPEGSFQALMGPSGSGKTTILNLISGLDKPSRGSIEVARHDLGRMDEKARAQWRAEHIGFIFQQYDLIPVLNAFDNVMLPLALTRLPRGERRRRAATALDIVGMSDRAKHRPAELSGGQQQRVAIARAFVADPDVVLADEPTGNLDARSGAEVLDVLKHLNRDMGKTILMVTHDPEAAAHADAVVKLHKGVLQ